MRSRVLLLALVLAILSGCGGSSAPLESTSADADVVDEVEPTESPAPTLGVVASVDDVQAAYLAAGGECSGELENRNAVVTALSSGVCPGSGTVLTAYIDHDDAKDAVDLMFGLTDLISFEVIIGDNWVVNPSGSDEGIVEAVAASMGGQIVSKAAVEDRPASVVETSGDFADDLEALTGIRPDDVDGFRAYIAEGICETDTDPDAVGPDAFSVRVKRYGDDDPASGTHPDLVRLVVAYDCPDRAELAEEYLSEVEG